MIQQHYEFQPIYCGPRYSPLILLILWAIVGSTIWSILRLLFSIGRKLQGKVSKLRSPPSVSTLVFPVLLGLFASLHGIRLVLNDVWTKGPSDLSAIAGSLALSIEPLMISIGLALVGYVIRLAESKFGITSSSTESR